MPELPEVETIKRQIEPFVLKKYLLSISIIPNFSPQKLFSIKRYGKVLFMELKDIYVKIHLRLTGILTLKEIKDKQKYLFAIFHFEDKKLFLYDIRKFSEIKLLNKEEMHKEISLLGKDVLSISWEEFKEMLSSSTKIKSLLLNQRKIAGLGTIYTDEILFRAKIHPLKIACTLKEEEAKILYKTMKQVVKKAIEMRGSSVKDYVDAYGNKGLFQKEHLVYGRKKELCRVCKTTLEYIKVCQRGTVFCPNCQKL